MSTPLREMGGELRRVDYGQGVTHAYVTWEVDCAACGHHHSHGCVYSDAPFHEEPRPGGGVIRVWQRVSGTTIDDLTLAPSYWAQGCDYHGHVIAGQWVPC